MKSRDNAAGSTPTPQSAHRSAKVTLTDAEGQALLEEFRAGDDRALDQIMAAYTPMVFGVLLHRYQLDLEDAEDLFQEVLLQLVIKADHIRNLRPWLLGTTLNQARKKIRRLVRDRNLAERVTRHQGTSCTPDDTSEQDLLNRAMARCSDDDRELLLLTFYGDLSYKELSRWLDRPIGSIGPMRGRALNRMRGIIEELETCPATAA